MEIISFFTHNVNRSACWRIFVRRIGAFSFGVLAYFRSACWRTKSRSALSHPHGIQQPAPPSTGDSPLGLPIRAIIHIHYTIAFISHFEFFLLFLITRSCTIHAEPLKGLYSTREALPMRRGGFNRKVEAPCILGFTSVASRPFRRHRVGNSKREVFGARVVEVFEIYDRRFGDAKRCKVAAAAINGNKLRLISGKRRFKSHSFIFASNHSFSPLLSAAHYTINGDCEQWGKINAKTANYSIFWF